MKFKLSSIFAVVVLMLGGCVSSRNKQCPDFGGGSWNIEQNVSPNSKKAMLLVDRYEISNVLKFEEHQAEFSKDYIKIKELALRNKQIKEIAKWTEEKIKETYIKINDEYKDCEFANNWIKK